MTCIIYQIHASYLYQSKQIPLIYFENIIYATDQRKVKYTLNKDSFGLIIAAFYFHIETQRKCITCSYLSSYTNQTDLLKPCKNILWAYCTLDQISIEKA